MVIETNIPATVETRPALYYTYRQNNSGGHFITDDKVCGFVVIQAHDEKDADRRAQNIGIYFDGVAGGWDCDCCGDRWSNAWQDGTEQPELYGKHPADYDDSFTKNGEVFCRVYHLDKSIKEYKK